MKIFSRLKIWILPLLILGALLSIHSVSAQLSVGVNNQDAINLGLSTETDIRTIVTRVIQVILGLTGLVAVGFIIYGGVTYTTAQGNEAQVSKAKIILRNSIIGLVVVIFSYALVVFILNQLGGPGGTSTGGDRILTCGEKQTPANPFCCSGTNSVADPTSAPCNVTTTSNFILTSITPDNNQVNVPRNAVIFLNFSQNINFASLGSGNVTVTETIGGNTTNVAGQFLPDPNGDPKKAIFKPNAICPSVANETCFSANAQVNVDVFTDPSNPYKILSQSGQQLSCSLAGSDCKSSFNVGESVDTQPPVIKIELPASGDKLIVGSNIFMVSATDEGGLPGANGYLNDIQWSFSGSNYFIANTGIQLLTRNGCNTPNCAVWNWNYDSTGQQAPANNNIYVSVTDITGRQAIAHKPFKLLPAHCADNTRNFDETGVDCGGACGSCPGESCSGNNNICSSDNCSASAYCNAACVCAPKPVIQNLDAGFPPELGADQIRSISGAPGNFMTIIGQNFGDDPGSIEFEASLNSFVTSGALPDSCVKTWNRDQIIVAVPSGTVPGAVRVTTADGGVDYSLDISPEPKIRFQPDDSKIAPGLCSINPGSGRSGLDTLSLKGANLGNSPATGLINFGGQNLNQTVTAWTPGSIDGVKTPNIQPGPTSVSVSVNGTKSNSVIFQVQDLNQSDQPFIQSVDPVSATPGSYLTVFGRGFGANRGSKIVKFKLANNNTYEGSFDFPATCGGGLWSDTQFVVKIPSDLPAGPATISLWQNNPLIQITNNFGDGTDTTAIPFTSTNGNPAPGLCALNPNSNLTSGQANNFSLGGDNLSTGGSVIVPGVTNNISLNFTVPNQEINFTTSATETLRTGLVKFRNSDNQISNGLSLSIFDPASVPAPGKAFAQIRFTTNQDPTNILINDQGCTPAGRIIAPSPGGNDICLNAIATLAFTYPENESSSIPTVIDPTSNSSQVKATKIFFCADSQLQNCDSNDLWNLVPAATTKYLSGNNQSLNGLMNFALSSNAWSTQAWYRLVVLNNVQPDADGYQGYEDQIYGSDVRLPSPYIYTFGTGLNSCQVEKISYPQNQATVYTGQEYNTSISLVGPSCQALLPTVGSTLSDYSDSPDNLALNPAKSPGFRGNNSSQMSCTVTGVNVCNNVFALGLEENNEGEFVTHSAEYTLESQSLFASQNITVKAVPFAVKLENSCAQGAVISPAPQPNSAICKNASMQINFTAPIDSNSVNSSTVSLTINGINQPLNFVRNSLNPILSPNEYSVIVYDQSSILEILPPLGKNLTPNSEYQVVLTTGIKTSLTGNTNLQGSFGTDLIPAIGLIAYSYSFSVEDTTCSIESVSSGSSTQAIGLGSGPNYGKIFTGTAYAANCQIINPTTLIWDFTIKKGGLECNTLNDQIGNTNRTKVSVAPLSSQTSCYLNNANFSDQLKISVTDSSENQSKSLSVPFEIFSPYLNPSIGVNPSGPLSGSARANIPTAITLRGRRLGQPNNTQAFFRHVTGAIISPTNVISPGMVLPAINICRNWSETQAVIGTPVLTADTFTSSPITQIYVTRQADSSTTIANSNSLDFVPDTNIRPILCSLNPAAGNSGDIVQVQGRNFGDKQESLDSEQPDMVKPETIVGNPIINP